MTTNMDSNGQGSGVAGSQPTPSAPPAANSAVDIGAVLEQLRATNERLERIERGSQSVKDKRIAGLQSEWDSLKSKLEEVLTGTPQPAPTQPPAAGNPQGAGDAIDVSKVISRMGLDANDPEVLTALRQETNQLALVNRLVNISDRKQQPAPPIPASQLMPTPGTPAQGETIESVTAELETLMKYPSQNMAKIRQLRAKLAGMQQ